MAGTVVTTVTKFTSVKKIKFAWTSDTDEVADATTTETFDGLIVLVTTDPGSTAPSDNYDIELLDSDSVDLLAGQGANRDTANTEHINSGMGGLAASTLKLSVAAAGEEKEGTVYVYLR
jgi:hypothetical protein